MKLMQAKKTILLLAAGLALGALPGLARAEEAPAARLIHVPPHHQEPEQAIEIELGATDAAAVTELRLHWRRIGEAEYQTLPFGRVPAGDFLARIPAEAVKVPGVEYYLAGESGPYAGPQFASAEAPFRVRVRQSQDERLHERRLEALQGNRSRANAMVEYVDFGRRAVPTADPLPDNYFQIQLDFTYRFVGALDSIRVGGVRLRAKGVQGGLDSGPLVGLDAGFDYGFGEVAFALHEYFGLTGRLVLGANAERFTGGARGELRIGRDPGTHLRLWAGHVARVGTQTGLELHWATVPQVPMAAQVEVTSWPLNGLSAVRLAYRAEIPLGTSVELQPQLSYQARGAQFGGLGLALGLAYEF
ncbi:MAG: hypothetical protein P1V51_13480 [Deltaproteobacteria bacterium]|nr:hypothetical protein [Deltaproteobacteria bacterium]